MGLFSKEFYCNICGKGAKYKLIDGRVCNDCIGKILGFIDWSNVSNMSLVDIRKALELSEKNKAKLQDFSPSKKYKDMLHIDENHRWWVKPDGPGGKLINPRVYSFEDIVSYELLEDGNTITKGGLGTAIVGGALFGGVGAITGGVIGKKTQTLVKSIMVKITITDINSSPVTIYLLNTGQTKKGSFFYTNAFAQAQQILSAFATMYNISHKDNSSHLPEQMSTADELLKLKHLLDEQVITEDEFEKAKEKLLS